MIMQEPLISAIITTYKGADSIERAIKSVLNQTYHNIEIIVVDDNGEGTSAQLETEAIVEKYSQVRYIAHEQNRNGSAARNTGIRAANGMIIELLDDDDEFLPEKTEKQYRRMLETKSSVCYSSLRVVFQNGVVRDCISGKEGYIFEDVISRKIEAPSSVLMFTKEAAQEISGFDESFQRHQDWEFLDRLSEKNKLACVPSICLLRHIVDRSFPAGSKQFEERRLFYLDKQKPLIDKLSKEQKKDLYYFHYSDIMRNCAKNKDFSRVLHWFIKAGRPLKLIQESIEKYKKYKERL